MTALLTALTMLVLLAWPSYAVCGCDEPGGMPCCDPQSAAEAHGTAPEPTPAPPATPAVITPAAITMEAAETSCCSAEPEPAPADETCSIEPEPSDLSYAATGCQQDLISAELPMASLPAKSASSDADGAVAPVPVVVTTTASRSTTRAGSHPPPRSTPAFVLNACFLI